MSFQQDIVETSDEATRKYVEETPKDDRCVSAVTAVMKATSFRKNFSKFIALANPKLGDKFFEEVCFIPRF
jgi:hypothetical protein